MEKNKIVFKTINTQVKPLLPGWVMPDDRQRGGKDYRLDAKLDIRQFTQMIINCVLHYNNKHYLTGYEKSEQMLKSGVEAIPVKLWDWGIRNCSGALKTFPKETIRLALMPKESGSVTEKVSISRSCITPARRPGKRSGLKMPGRTAGTQWISPTIPGT